jgi:streptogramin lyase
MHSPQRLSLFAAIALAALALPAGPARAALGDVIHSIPCPGQNPADLAWVDGELYSVIFSPAEQRGIYRLDPQTGDVLGMVPYAGVMPQGLTYDGYNLWQVCLTGDCVYKMDPVTGEVRAVFPAPGGSEGQPIGLGWDGEWLWLADSHAPEKIWQIDTLGVAQGEIPAPGASPYGLAWAEGFIWVSDNNMSGVAYIYKLDPATGEILDSFPCPDGGGSPNGITHDGEYLWIAVNTTDTIYQVDDGIAGGAGVDPAPAAPAGLRLLSARTEPAGRGVAVRLALGRAGLVRAQLFDLEGRRTARSEIYALAPGACDLRLTGAPLASGAYYLLVTGGGERATGKVLVVQ